MMRADRMRADRNAQPMAIFAAAMANAAPVCAAAANSRRACSRPASPSGLHARALASVVPVCLAPTTFARCDARDAHAVRVCLKRYGMFGLPLGRNRHRHGWGGILRSNLVLHRRSLERLGGSHSHRNPRHPCPGPSERRLCGRRDRRHCASCVAS